jgi:hypothetical protein
MLYIVYTITTHTLHTYVHIYTYINTHTHTHRHTHINRRRESGEKQKRVRAREGKKKMRPPVQSFFLPACPWVFHPKNWVLDSNKAPFVFLGDDLLFLVSPELSLSSMYLEPQ